MPRPASKKKVLKAFYETNQDATPEEIADMAGVSGKTAKKWIKKLEEEGDIVNTREIGRTSLYKLASPARRGASNSSAITTTQNEVND